MSELTFKLTFHFQRGGQKSGVGASSKGRAKIWERTPPTLPPHFRHTGAGLDLENCAEPNYFEKVTFLADKIIYFWKASDGFKI